MKTVLAIDSSTLHASVALASGTAAEWRVLASAASDVATHSEQVLALVDRVLTAAGVALAGIDGIAIGAGPGSFTGLRIGMATAKGLAFAAGKPLWAVSSLAALAHAAREHAAVDDGTLVVPILDARRGEIFAGFYRAAGPAVAAVTPERVLPPAELRALLESMLQMSGYRRAVALGDGLDVHARALEVDGGQLLRGLAAVVPGAPGTPPARAVALLALAGEHPDALESGAPVYIRLSEAEIKYPDGNPGGAFASRE